MYKASLINSFYVCFFFFFLYLSSSHFLLPFLSIFPLNSLSVLSPFLHFSIYKKKNYKKQEDNKNKSNEKQTFSSTFKIQRSNENQHRIQLGYVTNDKQGFNNENTIKYLICILWCVFKTTKEINFNQLPRSKPYNYNTLYTEEDILLHVGGTLNRNKQAFVLLTADQCVKKGYRPRVLLQPF